MHGAEDVDVSELAESRHHAELAGIPAFTALVPKLSGRVPREGEHRSVRKLASRRVQVAAEKAGSRRRVRETRSNRFQRLDLDPAIGRVGDVHALHLDPFNEAADGGFSPRWRQPVRGLERGASRDQHAGLPPRGRLPPRLGVIERGKHMRKTELGARFAPDRERSPRHLLERKDIDAPARDRGSLLVQASEPARDVPRE